ncbi:MAG: DUF4129 domain-containing protein [Nitrospirales bacterium]|nr:DUF4129 domain-containing protein [Nitrospirales bacterium]
MAGFFIYAVLKRKRPEERLLSVFLRKMEKRGFVRLPSQGLEEFVATVSDAGLRDAAMGFVREFQALYYRDRPFTREEIRRLRKRLLTMRQREG